MIRYTFSDLVFSPRKGMTGIVARINFPNGYTASVVRGEGTYGAESGLYELAVIHSGRIVYDTPVTSDVLGNLTEQDVSDRLNDVALLPVRGALSN